MLRIVFFGTPPFAARILSYLLEKKHNIVGVVTRPDRPRGRSQQIQFSAVKEVAMHMRPEIPLFQPEKVSTDESAAMLSALAPDLFVVVAFGEIIKTNILNIPTKRCINVHASLLPKYRGAAPIQRCLMNGEKETGVTIMEMVLQMDAGDMLAIGKTPISEEMTAGELEEKLCTLACPLLLDTIAKIEKGKVQHISQDHAEATFAPKITAEDRPIDWEKSATQLHNQIRALSPQPGALCQVKIGEDIRQLIIRKSRVVANGKGAPGATLSLQKNEWTVACGSGALSLLEVQLEGKKTLSIEDFIRGLQTSTIKIV